MRPSYEPVTLKRDVEAIQIPYGEVLKLPAGSMVVITQQNPSNFTVQTERGMLVRLEGKDADALGKEVPVAPTVPVQPASGPVLEQLVWEQLKTVYDPEIPVNVVDLGLIYECKILKVNGDAHRVEVKMAMTAPGCSMGDVLKMDAKKALQAIPGVKEAEVEVVFDPPWSQSMMSEAARLQLGMM